MPLPRYNKGAAGSQWKFRLSKIFEDLFDNTDPLYQIGGYYDINLINGALDLQGNEARVNGDDIYTLTQLVANATGSDVNMVDMNDETVPLPMKLRKDLVYSTGNTNADIPLMYYPNGYFDNTWDENGDVVNQPTLRIPKGSFNVPAGVKILEYSIFIFGAKMLHLLNIPQETKDQLDSGGYMNFDVPEEPGVLCISMKWNENTQELEADSYVNGVKTTVNIAAADQPDPTTISNEGLNMDDFLMYLTLPCWAPQKLLVIARKVTDKEVQKISDRMYRTRIGKKT